MLKLEIQKLLIGGMLAFIASAGVGNAAHNSQDKAISTIANHVQNDATPLATEGTGSIGNEAVANNPYLEPVDIPPYNADDPTHVLITPDNEKWTASVLNDPSYQHFYVASGKYSTQIRLTASGTSNHRRTLSLYNGDDRHPASLSNNQVASVDIVIAGSYWMIDRIANIDSTNSNEAMSVSPNASYNIFNRLSLKKFNNGFVFFDSGEGNVIQNSSFKNMNLNAPDGVAVILTRGTNKETIYSIKNTKLINNEFYNCNDSIQLVRRNRPSDGAYQDANYEGTIIDNNVMYIDNKIYTDGAGNLDPNGFFALAENAIDIKAGSENQNNPVIITNNKMWGYRKSDNLTGGARSDHGAAVVIHFGSKNIKMQHNIIFDSAQGVVAGAKDRFDFSLGYSKISNNIFHSTGSFAQTGDTYGAVMIWEGANVLFSRNNIVNARVRSIWGKATVSNVEFIENTIIDSQPPYNETPAKNVFDYNYYYNTYASGYASGANDTTYSTASEAKMADYTFTYEKFTASPKQKILNNIITTEDSPHYGQAGSTLGLELLFKSGFEN